MGIVKIIKGDIFDAFDNGKFDIIGHGCNCMNFMGAGIAATISKRYPKCMILTQKFTCLQVAFVTNPVKIYWVISP